MNFLDKQVSKIWTQRADQVDDIDVITLRSLRKRAKEMMRPLSAFTEAANNRLNTTLNKTIPILAPDDSDWAQRPNLWTDKISPAGRAPVMSADRFGDEVELFHDCRLNHIIGRQYPSKSRRTTAPFEFDLEVFDFSGSFLSIVYNFPEKAITNLSRRHIVQIGIEAECNKKMGAYVQLNVKHGPNVEQVVDDFDFTNPKPLDFDLAYTNINEKRVEAAWIAIILNNPGRAVIRITDLICSRRLRAEF